MVQNTENFGTIFKKSYLVSYILNLKRMHIMANLEVRDNNNTKNLKNQNSKNNNNHHHPIMRAMSVCRFQAENG